MALQLTNAQREEIDVAIKLFYPKEGAKKVLEFLDIPGLHYGYVKRRASVIGVKRITSTIVVKNKAPDELDELVQKYFEDYGAQFVRRKAFNEGISVTDNTVRNRAKKLGLKYTRKKEPPGIELNDIQKLALCKRWVCES